MAPNQRFVALADALGYTQFFAQRGVAADQANACLADPNKAQAVADLASKYGADGIEARPRWLINGTKLGVAEWPARSRAQSAGAR
jgi:hypothetical protein